MGLTAAEAIDTTTEVFGSHPGSRALHAKGVVATAVFRPTAEGATLSRAAHLQGPDVPATVRFSNGSGNPRYPDYAPDPRGLAAAGPAAAWKLPFVRLTLRPAATVARLKPWEARRRGADYLQREIAERLAAGPVLFSIEAQIANPGDPTDDPSAAWPKSRRRVTIGALHINGLDSERERDGDVLVFDPTRLTDGIECSADPVLNFRPRAYSESVAHRTTQDTP